jgi:drug/metabolite transporter (DMT)-like permease
VGGLPLALVLASAFVHAGWNMLVAGSEDSEAVTAVAVLAGSAAFAPVAVVLWDVDAAAVPYVLASIVLELVYLCLLARAYARADLTVVYPIARGSAPVLVLLASGLALAEAPAPLAAAGVVLVAAGVLLVRGVRAPGGSGDVLLAVAVGVCIASYTLVDARGVQHAAPLPYLELTLLGAAVPYAAGLVVRSGAGRLRAAASPRAALAGIGMFVSYGLVLAALTRAPAAPVAAVRETSVVIAAGLGALVLREAVGPARVAGAVLVAGGIAAIALA